MIPFSAIYDDIVLGIHIVALSRVVDVTVTKSCGTAACQRHAIHATHLKKQNSSWLIRCFMVPTKYLLKSPDIMEFCSSFVYYLGTNVTYWSFSRSYFIGGLRDVSCLHFTQVSDAMALFPGTNLFTAVFSELTCE